MNFFVVLPAEKELLATMLFVKLVVIQAKQSRTEKQTQKLLVASKGKKKCAEELKEVIPP